MYYDAWENEGDVDPLLSIVYAIVDELDIKFEEKSLEQILDKAVDIVSIFQKLVGVIIPGVSGVTASEIRNSLKTKSILEFVRDKRGLTEKINSFFTSVSDEVEGRLVIFVDELDRCSPFFAVKLLERISHYFKEDNITFVFSTNLRQLQHTIKQFYGADFEATRYLDKFFSLRVSLKAIDLIRCNKLLLESEWDGFRRHIDINLVNILGLQLRDIPKYLTSIKVVDEELKSKDRMHSINNSMEEQILRYYLPPVVLGLRLVDLESYERFVSGSNGTVFVDLIACTANNLNDMFNEIEVLIEDNDVIDRKSVVARKEKADLLYRALFVEKYPSEHPIKIGSLTFYKEDVNRVINNIISCLRY